MDWKSGPVHAVNQPPEALTSALGIQQRLKIVAQLNAQQVNFHIFILRFFRSKLHNTAIHPFPFLSRDWRRVASMGRVVPLRSLLLLWQKIPIPSLHSSLVWRKRLRWRPNWDGSMLFWLLHKHCVSHQNLRIALSTILSKRHQSRLVWTLDQIGFDDWLSGNTNSTTVDFFDNVFTFVNESVTVNCCRSDNTIELATCGLGASCAGSCSALGASLCPSGNCSGDCEMPFEQETNQIESRRWSAATLPSSAFKWCTRRCNVRRHPGCCYNPVCRRRKRKACRWMNYLTGLMISFSRSICTDNNFAGTTCPLPGSLPHGNWTCEMQEIPIHGTFFLDEDAQSYPGKPGYFWSANRFPHLNQPRIQARGTCSHWMKYIFSPSMLAGVWIWLCCPADTAYHLCQWRICKRVSLSAENCSIFTHS